MADTAVTSTNVVFLAKNTAVAAPTGQAVTTGNVAVLTPVAPAYVDGLTNTAGKPFKGRYMLVRMVESGAVSTSVVTPQAGVTGGTPANRAALGNGTAVTFTSGQEKYIQLELGRFLQADGTVRLAVSGTSGSVTFSVVNLSKNAA
jgi:hypothetical protein